MPKSDGFGFSVDFTTESDYFFNYALELNLHFAEYDKVTINGAKTSLGSKIQRVKSLKIKDGYLNKLITVSVDKDVDILYCPLKTVSQSEHRYDLTIQALSIALIFPFSKNFLLEGTLEVKDV